MNQTTIFVVNDGGHRYNLALDAVPHEDATLAYLTRGNVNPTDADRLSYLMTQTIVTSKPSDFLLLSGAPILNALALAIWITAHDICRLMIYDAKEEKYVVKIVDRENFHRLIEEATDL